MVGGELLKAEGKEKEAKKWWKKAERNMWKTIEIDRLRSRTSKFPYANLGNLYRLREEYVRAIDYYYKALVVQHH